MSTSLATTSTALRMDRVGFIVALPAEKKEQTTNSDVHWNPVPTEDTSRTQEIVQGRQIERLNSQVGAVESRRDVIQRVAPPMTSHQASQHEAIVASAHAPDFVEEEERIEAMFQDDIMRTLRLKTAEDYFDLFWEVQTDVMISVIWTAAAWSLRCQQCWELYQTLHPHFDTGPGAEKVIFQGKSYRLGDLQDLMRANEIHVQPGPAVFWELIGPCLDGDYLDALCQLDNELAELYDAGGVDINDCVVTLAQHLTSWYRTEFRTMEEGVQNAILRQRLLVRMSQEKEERRQRQSNAQQRALFEEHF